MPGLVQWFVTRPVAVGVVTFVLMWLDWALSVLQHREWTKHSANHYRSYPVNSIEGNPGLRTAVARGRLFGPRHSVVAVVVAVAVPIAASFMPPEFRPLFLGYAWGLFLIVSSTHLGNLIGYVASRRGIHGEIRLHQRTAYLIQAGRYAGLAALLVVAALFSGDVFMAGLALAAVASSIRQLAWLRRVPPIADDDREAVAV